MKNNFIPISFFCLSLGIFAFRSELTDLKGFHKAPLNSGGVGPGRTGAPGETSCTGCHAGTAQDGANENVLTPGLNTCLLIVFDEKNIPISAPAPPLPGLIYKSLSS